MLITRLVPLGLAVGLVYLCELGHPTSIRHLQKEQQEAVRHSHYNGWAEFLLHLLKTLLNGIVQTLLHGTVVHCLE